jgi:hypothetical protein
MTSDDFRIIKAFNKGEIWNNWGLTMALLIEN